MIAITTITIIAITTINRIETIMIERVLPSFQQPTFQKFTQINGFSAPWSAFHLKRVIIMFVSSEMLKCRLLK